MKVMCCNRDPVQPNKHIFKKDLAALNQRARSSHPGSAIRKQAQHDWNDGSRGLAQDPLGHKRLTCGLNSGPFGVKAHRKSEVHHATARGQPQAGLSFGKGEGLGAERGNEHISGGDPEAAAKADLSTGVSNTPQFLDRMRGHG